VTGQSPGQANGSCNPAVAVTPDGNNALLLSYTAGRVEVI
jgi:hypothetical protein